MLDEQDGADSTSAGTNAAVQLAAAVEDGTVPLSLVSAALQTSLLHCSASAAGSLPPTCTYCEQLAACANEATSTEGMLKAFSCVKLSYEASEYLAVST